MTIRMGYLVLKKNILVIVWDFNIPISVFVGGGGIRMDKVTVRGSESSPRENKEINHKDINK